MTIEEFTELIESDLHWRIGEFASIKALPIQYSMSEQHTKLVQTYLIPAIYAIWEGFVVTITRTFIKFINEKRIGVNNLHLSILTHALQSEFKFNESRTNVSSQRKLVKEIYNKLNNTFTISTKIPTESNVNYKVLTKILDSLNLRTIDKKHGVVLNKLLMFRNSIAHGDSALSVSLDLITELTTNIEIMMEELFLIFLDGINNEVYKDISSTP